MNISQSLIKWYNDNRRNLPWRNTNDPYSILIAEKLLQQTSVNESVIKVYSHILSEYPNIRSLSYAEPDDLIPIVATLGLNYRAYELVKLARVIVERHGGEIPDNLERLIELPGIGEYIARDILLPAIPKFLYYDEYYSLPSRISIEKLTANRLEEEEEKTISGGEK